MIADGDDDAGAANDDGGDDDELLLPHAVSVATAATAAAAADTKLRIGTLPLLRRADNGNGFTASRSDIRCPVTGRLPSLLSLSPIRLVTR